MANTFLMSVGIDVGKSLYEPELVPVANVLLKNAQGRQGEDVHSGGLRGGRPL